MSPSLVLGLVLGSIYGLLCHAFVGRHWQHLPYYWAAGLVGFFAGYAAAVLAGVEMIRLGTVPLLEGTLGAAVALWGAYRLLRTRGGSTVGRSRQAGR